MQGGDPYIVLTNDGADKIRASTLAQGELVLRNISSEDLYLVDSVETSRGSRSRVVISKTFVTLQWTGSFHAAQWIRLIDDELGYHHLFLSRRPGTSISLDVFRQKLPGVTDPGQKLGLVITHNHKLSAELLAAGASEFSGWLVRREGVEAISIEVEPLTVGLQQLAGKWPIEQLANNSVMVVGCGSIGSAAVEALAGYGVGRVELVDPDRFLWHNMLRHTLGPESVGRYKVTAMKDQLSQRWPTQTFNAHKRDVVSEAHYVRALVKNVDLLLCAADGIAPRRVVSHLARRAGKPAVLACVLDQGAIGEIIRLRPSPRLGCLLCLRNHLSERGAIDAEADQELDYGTGHTHQPMTAVPPDLRHVGTLAGKVAVATLLESLHGDHTQRLPGEHAVIGLRPNGDLAAPFNVDKATSISWSSLPVPRPSCPTCSVA